VAVSDNDRVQRLQQRANTMRDQPIKVILGSELGPYRLPRCHRAAVNVRSPGTAELILDTQQDQRILVEIDIETFRSLHKTMSFVLKKWTK
jgi:hypothetical protein